MIHRLRGRPSARRTPEVVEERVRELYRGQYAGWNMAHFAEWLKGVHGIALSREGFRTILIDEPTRPRRKKRRRHRRWRARRKRTGELVQMDASIHPWLGEGGEEVVLISAVGDQDSKVRYYSAMSLGSYSDARAREVLVKAAQGEDETIAKRASTSLEYLDKRYPRSFEELLADFKQASPHERTRAFQELAELEDARAKTIVTTALSDPDPQMRAEAYEYVPFYNRPESMRLLTAALSDESPRVRARAAYRDSRGETRRMALPRIHST